MIKNRVKLRQLDKNIDCRLQLRKPRMKIEIVNRINGYPKILLILLCLYLSSNNFAQTRTDNTDDSFLPLIEKIKEKSKKTRVLIQSEYQLKYKRTIESQEKKYTGIYEMYCLNNGKSFCKPVQIEKNGVPISSSKIQKSRKTAAKDLVQKNEDFLRKDDPLTYGIFINKVWVDPTIYLENCQRNVSSIVNLEERPTYFVKLTNCSIDNSFNEWEQYISFMPKTEADIWIDEKDLSITKMNIYAKSEFSSEREQNKPVIKLETVRMTDGYWFVKNIKIETTNKAIFSNLNDNWEYEFFDFKKLRVEVGEPKLDNP